MSDARGLVVGAAVLVGAALLAGPVGLVWAVVAPRSEYVLTPDGAELADPEPPVFAAADLWFVVVSAVAGLLCGAAAYLLGGRRHGVAKALGLAVGSVGAGLLAWHVGQLPDMAEFRQAARTLPAGAVVEGFLTLTTPLAVAIWPVAALAAFGLLAVLHR